MKYKGNGSVTAVIVAGGRGVRLGQNLPKPLVLLGSRPLVSYSLETFEKFPGIDSIILVCGEDWYEEAETLGKRWAPHKIYAVVTGGTRRSDSVRAGLKKLPPGCSIAAIHDAARPFVSHQVINNTLDCLNRHHGAVPAVPLADTLRKHHRGISAGTLDRSRFILTQTPQCFHRDILEEAFNRADEDEFTGTDDASYVERLPGVRISIVEGDPDNFKITTKQDVTRAQLMVESGRTSVYRCGEGFDAHRFTVGKPLVIGGLTIPFDLGLHGHSDADVLCHAIGDALLGAISLGDLGQHFPDTDPAYKGISSITLLERIRQMVVERGYSICNVDSTLVLQLPKIAPHRDKIRANLARALEIDVGCISVKATTTEQMGPEGRGEGITCRVIVLVEKISG